MPSRPDLDVPRGPGFQIHQDIDFGSVGPTAYPPSVLALSDDRPMFSRHNTLTPASPSTMNSRNSPNGASYHDVKQGQTLSRFGTSSSNNPDAPRRVASTIRPVSSIDGMRRTSVESFSKNSQYPGGGTRADSGFASSVNSNASAMSTTSQTQLQVPNGTDKASGARFKSGVLGSSFGTGMSGPDATSRAASPSFDRGSVEIPERDSSLGSTGKLVGNSSSGTPHIAITSSPATQTPDRIRLGRSPASTEDVPSSPAEPGVSEANLSTNGNNWDSTVGKAGLGKTGRVINKLVGENESLKRDIRIEKLKADEARQSARLLEDKMDRVISDYESRLLEASVTKTLLARKERQVESLQAAVELERERTAEARKRETTWREQLESTRDDSKRAVEEATNNAMLLEGRYNAISSHWRDQGVEVNQTMARMRKEIAELVEERQRDDEKIAVLRDLCDQQDGNIRALLAQKEEISRKFEAYKAEQERALHDIKTKAAEREAEQEKNVEESRAVLHKLKWALNVKDKIDWAQ